MVEHIDHAAMEIHATRLENLRRLMRDRFENKQSALARATGIAPGYVSFLFTGRKHLGEVLAREIERRLKLTPYSLDQSGATPPVVAREGQATYGEASPRIRAVIERLLGAAADGRLSSADIRELEVIAVRVSRRR